MPATSSSFSSDFLFESDDSLVGRRIILVMAFRVGLISILLGATLVFNYRSASTFWDNSTKFLLGTIAVTYFLTIIYALWFKIAAKRDLLFKVQFAADVLLCGALTYATGGIASGFTFLFDLWVILAAATIGGRTTFYYAGASALLLIVLALSMKTRILVPLSDQPIQDISIRELIYYLSINIVALFAVAILVNSLVSRLEVTGQGLEVERAAREDLSALYSDVIRSLTVGLVISDSTGEIRTFNPAAQDILGLRPEDGGSSLEKWLPDVSAQISISDTSRSRGLGVGTGPDGRRVPIDYIIAPLSGADGNSKGSIVVFNDLTEVRRLEAALERSRRLAALGELAASLAHEIRNPLGAVWGSFQLLTSHPDMTEEDRSLADIISREIQRIERLVNDMLDYARPRRKKLIPSDLGRLVEEVVRVFAMDVDREVAIDIIDGAMVEIDQGQIRQVMWNLLRNASQATEAGDEINISVCQVGDKLIVEVADTGGGIAPEDQKRIFDPFFSKRERGLGLGLALCRRIIEDHKGEIEAESDLEGAIFRVTLPIV